METLLILLVKTLATTFGERLADKAATELVCVVTKGCPEKIDKLADNAKALGQVKPQENPPT